MPTYLVFNKIHFMLASEFSTVYHPVSQSASMTRKITQHHVENTKIQTHLTL